MKPMLNTQAIFANARRYHSVMTRHPFYQRHRTRMALALVLFLVAFILAASTVRTTKLIVLERPRDYSTATLKGRKLGGLFADYTGITGEVPEKIKVDFNGHLLRLWQKKEKAAPDNKVVKETGTQLVKEYVKGPRTLITAEQYVALINSEVEAAQAALDWEQVGKLKNLSEDQLALVKKISLSIEGTDILAYSLTELMPGRDGTLNLLVLDFLLQNAGSEYIERLPALYDTKTSFGPFQFTEYALYDTPRGQRGASIINRALPQERRIPGSVSKLRGTQHYVAAYLFMIDNFANLAKAAQKEEYETLSNKWRAKKDDLIIFSATAHHGPYGALRFARRWLANDAKLPYVVSCSGRYIEYARKTQANLDAVRARF
jgi:hypothetical protein